MTSSRHPMRLSRTTLVLLVMLGLWFGLDFIGVPRLVDREPLVSLAGLMLALLAAFLLAGLLKVRYAAPVFGLSLVVWLWLQIETHWGTYLLPASERKLQWYGRVFGDHLRLLPSLPDRTTPDAYHTVLLVLLLASLASAIRDTLRREPGPPLM